MPLFCFQITSAEKIKLAVTYVECVEIEKNKNLFHFLMRSGIINSVMHFNREVFVCRDRLIRNWEIFQLMRT